MLDTLKGTHVRTLTTTLSALLLLALLLPDAAHTQTGKKPISRKGLVDAVKINGLSTTELVQHIQRRGVDFEMTSEVEGELRSVGARPEIIEAARANHRAPAVAAAATTPAPNRPVSAPRPSGPAAAGPPVPPGPPLAKNEIVMMLQGGLPPARVEQFVEARGVSFAITSEISREITAAGGTRSLIGAIGERAPGSEPSSPSPNSGGGNAAAAGARNNAPDYDDLIDRATSSLSAADWNSAIAHAQQAAQFDSSQPTAYSLLGMSLLYGRRDIPGAEQAMRSAIERGGSARFLVYHDHGSGHFQNYCLGSFFVTKTGVSFKANDGLHTFETADSNIKEAKPNTWFGSEVGAFHVKPVQKINGTGNFNFAPATQQRVESQLLIRLIQGY